MTNEEMLALKQQLTQMSEEERLTVSAHLLRLWDKSPEGCAEASRLMAEMDRGIKFHLSDFAK